MTSTKRQRFSLLSGRVSMIRTVSPVFASFCFVVRIKLFHLFNDFTELGMRHTRDRPHHNRLVHAAGNHFAGSRLA